ncbi:coenzyme F420-0:L-glutamate ligase [Janibacter sp. G56]|uniref:coenzyme F420-0:L-glutamate ligase n=1 Tax=Janibacter sp. G56 TaxID=3418717 RepID=UPI003D069ED9
MLTVLPLTGIPELAQGDDLVGILLAAAETAGGIRAGDVLVVSSKALSKVAGLRAPAASRESVVAAATVRVVAERVTGSGHVTRIVESAAGPVMAAAGVDASNVGPADDVLALPLDADADAAALREELTARAGLSDGDLAVVVTDTAGRPWRVGQTDFALGASGLRVLEDHRGGQDADGRGLAVTARAIADELAAAADLVKGKVDRIPAALVRGADRWVVPAGQEAGCHDDGAGARSLVRGRGHDWFSHGTHEAVWAALGLPPGSAAATEVGLVPLGPDPLLPRTIRAVRAAMHGLEEDAADGVGLDLGDGTIEISGPDPFVLGRLVARLEVALWAEGLAAESQTVGATIALTLTDLRP